MDDKDTSRKNTRARSLAAMCLRGIDRFSTRFGPPIARQSGRNAVHFVMRFRSSVAAAEKTYQEEISSLRILVQRMTFLSMALSFLLGLIIGGIISSPPSLFIIGTLVLGFPAAISYGSALGLRPVVSALLAVATNCFVAYASLRSIRAVENDSRVAPYVDNIRKRYDGVSRRLMAHAGTVGVGGSLAIFCFLIGWWVAVLVAYILDVRESTAMKGIFVGNLAGAITSLAIFQGLLMAIPHTGIVSLIFVTIFVVSAFLTRRAGRRKPQPAIENAQSKKISTVLKRVAARAFLSSQLLNDVCVAL